MKEKEVERKAFRNGLLTIQDRKMRYEDARCRCSASEDLSLSPADIFDSVFQRFERFVQPGVKTRFEGTDRETSDRLTQGQFFSFESFLLLADFCKQAPLPSARHF